MSLHSMHADCGVPDEQGHTILPEMMNLTSETMTHDGVYLLEDGESILIWVGPSVDTAFLQALFGSLSFEQLDSTGAEAMLQKQFNPLASKVANIIRQVRAERSAAYMDLQII